MRFHHQKEKRYTILLFSTVLIFCLAASAMGQASDNRNKTGDIFKSLDGGATWTAINTGMTVGFITSLAIDPASPEVVYAGSDRGIFKSTDGGNTWAVPNGGITLFTIKSIVIDPLNHSTLYAGTISGGAYKSTDSGVTWSRINNGVSGLKIIRTVLINPVNPSILYLGADGEILKSTNGGGNWELVLKLSPSGDEIFPQDLILDPRNPSTLYVIGLSRIHKSTDAGTTWKDITGQIITPHFLGIDTANPATLYVINHRDVTGLFKSTDGGSNWTGGTLSNPTLTRTGIFQLAIDPVSTSTLYMVASQGVFKSTDGGSSWAETGLSKSNGFTSPVFSLAVNPVNPSIIYAGAGGGVSPNDNSPWITFVSVSGNKLRVSGEGFDDGAVILLDGTPQKTNKIPESPSRALVSKEAGKKVKKNPETRIQVRNSNGKLSQTVVRPVD